MRRRLRTGKPELTAEARRRGGEPGFLNLKRSRKRRPFQSVRIRSAEFNCLTLVSWS